LLLENSFIPVKKTINPTKTVRQSSNLFFRATIDTSQIVDTDEEKSFPVVFATETPVARYSWINDEKFNEILVCNPANIRKDRLDTQNVPLLDNHDQWSGAAGQLGRVDSYTIANGECRAKILFSMNPDNAGLWKDIKAGIIKGISAGYRVFKYLREEVINTDTPNYRAIDWEPMEISLAPVPADFNSSIRQDQSEGHEVIIENFSPSQNTRSNNMEKENVVVEPTTTPEKQVRSDNSATTTVAVDEVKIRNEERQAERTRTTEIVSLVRSVNLPGEFAEKLVADGVTIDNARKAVIDEIAKRDKTTTGGPNASARGDENQGIRNAMVDGLMHRAQPGVY
jgi:phage head maturation protease